MTLKLLVEPTWCLFQDIHQCCPNRLKPATLSEFLGDHTKGQAFLNSCNLYIGLAQTQFANDQAKIYWVLSFMKGNHAVHFMDWTIQLTQQMGSLPWATWDEFRLEFIWETKLSICERNDSHIHYLWETKLGRIRSVWRSDNKRVITSAFARETTEVWVRNVKEFILCVVGEIGLQSKWT